MSTFKYYNRNPHEIEQILHKFLGKSCLNIDVFDKDGDKHTPTRAWFMAPIDIIEQSIALILSGEIVNYKYDYESDLIAKKS